MALDVGEVAPTFTLAGVDGTTGEVGEYALESFRGQPVVLVFYPGDNTPICTRQLNAYTDDIGDFAGAGAQVLALSPQSVESHAGFATAQGGFAFPLLAEHRAPTVRCRNERLHARRIAGGECRGRGAGSVTISPRLISARAPSGSSSRSS